MTVLLYIAVLAALAAVAVVSVLCKVVVTLVVEQADRRVASVEEDRRALTASAISANGHPVAARLAAPAEERAVRTVNPLPEGM